MTDFSSFTDLQLQQRAAAGEREAEEALVERYMQLVRASARPFFLAGGDSEDLIQEGMFGLLSAVPAAISRIALTISSPPSSFVFPISRNMERQSEISTCPCSMMSPSSSLALM